MSSDAHSQTVNSDANTNADTYDDTPHYTSVSNMLDSIQDNEYVEQTVKRSVKEMTPEFIQKLNAQNEHVKHAYEIFKHCYKTAVKPIFVSDIINGEVIDTHPDNIMVTDPIEPQYLEDKALFERMCKACTKKLYRYQQDAILKLRELENRGYTPIHNTRNADSFNKPNSKYSPDDVIVSNGYLLSLPIGSGKSLVFQFLALFYREVPRHPIVISRDGKAVPMHFCSDLKIYPYYYENCGYIPSQSNGVVVLEDYIQRKCTVILTHLHLLQQMKQYFETDYPAIVRRTKIQYAVHARDVKDLSKLDILVIVATQENIEQLMYWSYAQPFMRVIIDDYTSMEGIANFRQVRASSTIFVSGSGFNRKESDIPSSYYTLKHMPVNSITLVGKPEDTYEGIFRDTIATMELMGSSCKFSQYQFVSECENLCHGLFRVSPDEVYPILKQQPTLHHYISLMFIIRNFDRVKGAIMNVEKDLNTINPKTDKPYLDKSRLKYYFEWQKMLESTGRDKSGMRKNPLYNKIYCDPAIGNQGVAPIVSHMKCMCCDKDFNNHGGYGVISCCCGAFYCSDCIKSMTTQRICNSETGEYIDDGERYYCSCCRHVNPRFVFNVSKKKDASVYAFSLADSAFDVSELRNRPKFEYYFYMFMNGFKPLTHGGRSLNIKNDIDQGAIDKNVFRKKLIPALDMILPKDQLCILTLSNINNTLGLLGITPKKGSILLFYKAPDYMQSRIINYYNDLIKKNNPNTAIVGVNNRGKKEQMQPIALCSLCFMNNVSQLIGMHQNVVSIVLWETPSAKDMELQILGRCYRINNWGNELTFYINTTSDSYN